MPELPEVDYARRQLERWLEGRKIVEVTARAGSPLRETRPKDLERLVGRTLREVTRTGKHLALRFAGGSGGELGVHLHLGMTGKIVHRAAGESEPRFSKVRFRLGDGEVHFCDSRRFGRFRLLKADALDRLAEVEALGPDAWKALPEAQELGERLARSRRALKVVLLDQAMLAGLGNIHAVEALWRAKLSPFVRANALKPKQLAALRRGIHESLAFAMKNMEIDALDGDVLYVEEGAANRFAVYDRAGKPCRRKDHAPIKRVVQAQRSTYYCPFCQR
jgi:formamidopyrimidine-DNA glycosylase